jgi:LexA-binding, inner membrane-associated putative hydrolase
MGRQTEAPLSTAAARQSCWRARIMANFPTHILVGTVVAGSLATLTLAADVIAPENLVAVTLAGCVGSVLPDIDLKDSRPSKALFAGLAIFFSFALLFHFAPHLSILEMWSLWIGTLLFVLFGLQKLFHKYAVHRGVWHTIAAALVCSFATAIFFYYVLGRPDGVGWLAAGFMFIGYLTHLTLDEIYSVDVLGAHIKKSFGTALKFVDMRYKIATAAMLAAGAALLLIVPPMKTFVDGMSSRPMWTSLHERLLPHHQWFALIRERGRLAAAPEEPPQATGSLPALTDAPASTSAQPAQ